MYVIYKIFCSFLLFFFPFIYVNPHQKTILYIIMKICEERKFIKNGRTKAHSSINKWTSVAALLGPNIMLTFHSAVSIPASLSSKIFFHSHLHTQDFKLDQLETTVIIYKIFDLPSRFVSMSYLSPRISTKNKCEFSYYMP